MSLFPNRNAAAWRLIERLPPEIDADWLVLGLPRGGVPLAAVIARHLGAPLDVLIVRKVGAPGNSELALAAVTGPGPEGIVINHEVQAALGLDDATVVRLSRSAVTEVARRSRAWSPARPHLPLRGRDVLVVDDGVATGTTLAAAIAALRRQGVRRIAVAVPVALGQSLAPLHEGDDPPLVICPYPESRLSGVGQAYNVFPQVSDDEVRTTLTEHVVPTKG
jgi:putative phosphoribosyl transferase